MQNLRIGSTITITVGKSQTSDMSSYQGATVNNITDAYVEFLPVGATSSVAYPWHRVLSISVYE